MSKLTRREFLLTAAAAGAVLILDRPFGRRAQARPRAVPPHRVVHAHSPEATSWDYATGWYGDYVNQGVVDAMTDRGVMALTDTTTLVDAWGALLPAYTAGQKVAIKINLNNAGCDSSDNVIDALPQPVNAVIRGLKSIGVSESDIDVYDVTNGWHQGAMPERLVNKVAALFPAVQYDAYASWCPIPLHLGYSATERIHFNVPAGKPPISDRPVCNALVDADYLINMPIMKKHGMAGVTLGFKNHFGSLEHCDYVHWSVDLGDGNYTSAYNGLVDIYNNPHIRDKTVLTVGDALYAARVNNYSEIPSPWPSFDDQSPNSLFFSTDPVAIDSVMVDFLNEENGVPDGSDDYLALAAASGLGAYERWDASHEYQVIDYQRIEVALNQPEHLYLPLVERGG
jgi:uncharacterized protein (DUF362 family)